MLQYAEARLLRLCSGIGVEGPELRFTQLEIGFEEFNRLANHVCVSVGHREVVSAEHRVGMVESQPRFADPEIGLVQFDRLLNFADVAVNGGKAFSRVQCAGMVGSMFGFTELEIQLEKRDCLCGLAGADRPRRDCGGSLLFRDGHVQTSTLGSGGWSC